MRSSNRVGCLEGFAVILPAGCEGKNVEGQRIESGRLLNEQISIGEPGSAGRTTVDFIVGRISIMPMWFWPGGGNECQRATESTQAPQAVIAHKTLSEVLLLLGLKPLFLMA